MKQRLVLLCCALVALLGMAIPITLATPVADLTALARYYPESAVAFAAIRTDDAYLQTLDSLLNKVTIKLPQFGVPRAPLKLLLDMTSQQATSKSFAEGIRPWLGDTAAVGLTSLEGIDTPNAPVLIAISLKDRQKAEAAWDQLLAKTNFKKATNGSLTVYTSNVNTVIGLGTDTLFVATTPAAIPQQPLAKNLTTNARFKETLGLLPAPDYNIVVYLDARAIGNFAMKLMSRGDGSPGLLQMQMALLEAVGQQAVGFTLLDDRSLVVDAVANPGDLRGAFEKLGLSIPALPTLDPQFAAHIPADASLVIHARSMKRYYDFFLQTVRAFQPPAQWEETRSALEKNKAEMKAATGIDWDQDVVDWMTGDFAGFVSVDTRALLKALFESADGNIKLDKFPINFGFVVQATDAAKARNLAAALGKLLSSLVKDNPDAKVSAATIGGAPVTVLTQMTPVGSDQKLPLEVVIGANDRLFLVATREAATGILTGAPGLNTAPGFQEAGKYLLPNPSQVWYMDANGFSAFLVTMVGVQPTYSCTFSSIVSESSTPTAEEKERQQKEVEDCEKVRGNERQQAQALFNAVFDPFSSSSISSQMVDTVKGQSRTRLVVTLGK